MYPKFTKLLPLVLKLFEKLRPSKFPSTENIFVSRDRSVKRTCKFRKGENIKANLATFVLEEWKGEKHGARNVERGTNETSTSNFFFEVQWNWSFESFIFFDRATLKLEICRTQLSEIVKFQRPLSVSLVVSFLNFLTEFQANYKIQRKNIFQKMKFHRSRASINKHTFVKFN